MFIYVWYNSCENNGEYNMSKGIKIFLIISSILIFIALIDTLQAKIFDNRPFLKITENYNNGNVLKKDKGIFVYTYVFTNGEKVTVYRWEKYSPPEVVKNINEKENNMENINVSINDKLYNVILEDNKTVKAFLKILPQEFAMTELNGNEKYVYMDTTLPTNAINPKHINKGDIMLYGNNCLVIFYKSFNTNYSYTKIGHIDNLDEIDSNNVVVKFGS